MSEAVPFAFALVRHPTEPILQLAFEYQNAPTVTVLLEEGQLQTLLALVQGKIQRGHHTPISMDRFRPGVAFAVAAWRVEHRGENILLTLQATLPEDNREVTVPWLLSKAEAKEVVAELAKAL